jgi:hypothetical protein
MDYAEHVDAIWAAFCGTLPLDLQHEARVLARAVGLVPVGDIPWSGVFKNEVTLAAPALFASAMPLANSQMVMTATTAHMLAIIDAFAVDRMLDRQATGGPQMQRLLEHVRAGRDRAICELSGDRTSPYHESEYDAVCAINTERLLLRNGVPLSFSDYSRLSLAKQAVAFPASLALAQAAGWNGRRQRAVQHVLRGIVLGLQFHDDVVDWEEDWRNGGAWAVSLARGLVGPQPVLSEAGEDLPALRRQVHASGVLATMMNLSRLRYREAQRLATSLGAEALAAWAREQETGAAELTERESGSAGYAVRAHQLSCWAMEVFG